MEELPELVEPPIVGSTDICNYWEDSGTRRCGQPTGSDLSSPGPDADLCPVHRAEMAAQRNRPRPPSLADRVTALEAKLK